MIELLPKYGSDETWHCVGLMSNFPLQTVVQQNFYQRS